VLVTPCFPLSPPFPPPRRCTCLSSTVPRKAVQSAHPHTPCPASKCRDKYGAQVRQGDWSHKPAPLAKAGSSDRLLRLPGEHGTDTATRQTRSRGIATGSVIEPCGQRSPVGQDRQAHGLTRQPAAKTWRRLKAENSCESRQGKNPRDGIEGIVLPAQHAA